MNIEHGNFRFSFVIFNWFCLNRALQTSPFFMCKWNCNRGSYSVHSTVGHDRTLCIGFWMSYGKLLYIYARILVAQQVLPKIRLSTFFCTLCSFRENFCHLFLFYIVGIIVEHPFFGETKERAIHFWVWANAVFESISLFLCLHVHIETMLFNGIGTKKGS